MTMTDGAPVIEHAIGIDGRLDVRLPSAELSLRAVDGEAIRVYTPDGKPLPDHVEVRRDVHGLTIRQPSESRFGLTFGTGPRAIVLVVEIPRAAETAVEIASGRIEATGLGGHQAYRSVSGDIRLEDIGGQVEATLVSGDLDVTVDGTAAFTIKTVSGDVEVRDGALDSLRIATTSGDVRVASRLARGRGHAIETLSGDVDLAVGGDLRISARTLSGDLRSELPHRSEGRMGRRTLVIGDGGTEIDFRSVSGDLRVRDVLERGVAAADRAPAGPPAVGQPLAAAAVDIDGPAGQDGPPDQPADDDRLAILKALERGEIDVAEATARLAAVDGGDD
jgi:hypothetical protein